MPTHRQTLTTSPNDSKSWAHSSKRTMRGKSDVLNSPELRYDDRAVSQLAMLKGVPIINIRNTNISPSGARKLQEMLPDAVIEYGS